MPSKKAVKQQTQPEKLKLNINLPVDRHHEAVLFDGQARITMWCYYSGIVQYTMGAMKRAIRNVPPPNPVVDVPDDEQIEAMSAEEQEALRVKLEGIDPVRTHFDTFVAVMPSLVSIEFDIADPEQVDEDLFRLYSWWVKDNAKQLFLQRNYEALWESLLQYELGPMVGILLSAWYLTRRAKLPASAGVSNGASKATDPAFLAESGSTT